MPVHYHAYDSHHGSPLRRRQVIHLSNLGYWKYTQRSDHRFDEFLKIVCSFRAEQSMPENRLAAGDLIKSYA